MIAGYVKKNHPVSRMAAEMGFSVEPEVNSEIRIVLKKSFKGDNSVSDAAISETNFLIGYAKDINCTVPALSVIASNGASDVILTVVAPMDWYFNRVASKINGMDSMPETLPFESKDRHEFGYVPGV